MSSFLAGNLSAPRPLDLFFRHLLDDLFRRFALENGRQLWRVRRVHVQRRTEHSVLAFEVRRWQQLRTHRLRDALVSRWILVVSVRWVVRRLMMVRFNRIILLAGAIGRTGRVIRRAHRYVRTRSEALRIRRQSTVRASVLSFELRRSASRITKGDEARAEQNKASRRGERRNQRKQRKWRKCMKLYVSDA